MERPVKRDPRSGQIINYSAFEGWKPREFSSWWLVLAGVIAVALAIWSVR